MRKLLRTIIGVVGLIAIVAFAVANRGPIAISFWPLPFDAAVPVYVVLLAGIVIGVVLGGIATWLSGHRRRVAFRDTRDRLAAVENREHQRQRAEEAAAAAAAARQARPAMVPVAVGR
jgi:uncharacterized integral membrane protein